MSYLKSLYIVIKKAATQYKSNNHTSDSVRSRFGSNESEGDLFILSGDGGRGNMVKDFG